MLNSNQKRYFTFSQYLQRQFGTKVWKIPVHAPFSCPNRDGTVGVGGCIYCNNLAFSPDLQGEYPSITSQIEAGLKRFQKKGKVNKFFVYFQSYTNTYAPITELQNYYQQALQFDDVVGLAVGTRPDCISEDILNLLESYTNKVEVWIEYGLQSIHDRTLKLINRGHLFADFENAIQMTAPKNIKICVHVIIGLPGEDRNDILATARKLSQMPIHGIKIHPLQVHRHTKLENWFNAGKIQLMNLEEYVTICCDFLELLPPELVIQRLTADAPASILVAPAWCLNKMEVLNAIDQELNRRGSFQGKEFSIVLNEK